MFVRVVLEDVDCGLASTHHLTHEYVLEVYQVGMFLGFFALEDAFLPEFNVNVLWVCF